jgi:molybdate transport system ATP-binding protein
MSEPVVHIKNLSLRYRQKAVLEDLDWMINPSEHWVLTGESGSGKTSLAKALAGLIPYSGSVTLNFDETLKAPSLVYYVANWYQFKDLEGQSNFYYQQRYNHQAFEVTSTVLAELEEFGRKQGLAKADLERPLEALAFSGLLHSSLIQLSSGEHKKLQLVKALWLKPQLLILDQPYNGLDKASRQNLNAFLEELPDHGSQLILISNDQDLPSSVNKFAEIVEGKLIELEYRPLASNAYHEFKSVPAFLAEAPVLSQSSSADVIKMIDVNISYGDKQVLKNINWEVKAGEKWLLQGPNGSGKSTLLSLVSGDHPQAYANNFYLFGHKRGTGESIWDIKKRIGLISPELHWYFDPSATVWQSIASGFYDSSGLFCEPGTTKHSQVNELVDYFELSPYKNVLMNELPLGKQRLALLARTIIKNPELLILDEPCQGLDQQQTIHFNRLVDDLCKQGTTLIYVGHFDSQLPDCIEKRILLENGEVKSVENILERA